MTSNIRSKVLCLPGPVLISLPNYYRPEEELFSLLPRDIAIDPKYSTPPAIYERFDPHGSGINTCLAMHELYRMMLSKWPKSKLIAANEQPLKFLETVLELSLNQFQAVTGHCYWEFRQTRGDPKNSIHESLWRPMRDAMVMTTFSFAAFKRYDSHHTDGVVQHSPEVRRLLRRFDQLYETASGFEQQIRDDLQLQVGYLSLLESKASIEQSKIALGEGKRLRLRRLYLHWDI